MSVYRIISKDMCTHLDQLFRVDTPMGVGQIDFRPPLQRGEAAGDLTNNRLCALIGLPFDSLSYQL